MTMMMMMMMLMMMIIVILMNMMMLIMMCSELINAYIFQLLLFQDFFILCGKFVSFYISAKWRKTHTQNMFGCFDDTL